MWDDVIVPCTWKQDLIGRIRDTSAYLEPSSMFVTRASITSTYVRTYSSAAAVLMARIGYAVLTSILSTRKRPNYLFFSPTAISTMFQTRNIIAKMPARLFLSKKIPTMPGYRRRHFSEASFNAFGAKYDWKDPFSFRQQLTDEEMAVWEAARAFCQGELQPIIVEANRHEITADHALMRKMGDVGLLGATIPTEYGGVGLGYASYGLIASEVERVDSGYRSAMSVQSSLVMHSIHAYGTEDMKRKYLPELASGNMIGCFGLTVRIVVG